MPEVNIVLAYRGAPVTHRPIEAVATPVPGIVAHPAVEAEGWMLTHAASGFAVGWFPEASPEALLGCAQELAGLADWTVPVPDTRSLAPAVLPVIRRWGARRRMPGMSFTRYQASGGRDGSPGAAQPAGD